MTDEHDDPSVTGDVWSADELRTYQARITELAETLRQDVIHNTAQTAFNLADVEILRAAVGVLQRFENRVIHGHSNISGGQPHHNAARNEAQQKAEQLAKALFPVNPDNTLQATKLALAIEASLDEPKHRSSPNSLFFRIEQALDQTDPADVSQVIYQCYNQQIARLAVAFLDVRGKYLNDRYVEDWSLRVRKALDNPAPIDQQMISRVEDYLAKR